MAEPRVKYSRDEISSAIEDSEKNRKERSQPYGGEVEGYKFAKARLDNAESIFQRYKTASNKMSFWYSLVSTPLGRLPVLGYYITMRAQYWDGYHVALSNVLGVTRHVDSTGEKTSVTIKDHKTGEVIHQESE